MSAYTAHSGGYQVIPARTRLDYTSPSDAFLGNHAAPTQVATQNGTSSAAPTVPWPLVVFATICGFIALGAAIPWLFLAADEDSHRAVRMLLFLLVCVSLTLCGAAVLHLLRVRADDRRADRLQSAIDAAVDVRLQAVKTSLKRRLAPLEEVHVLLADFARVADLPDWLKDRSVEQGKIFTAEVRELRELAVGRLDALEQRAEGTGGADLKAMAERYMQLTRTFADRLGAIETKLEAAKPADDSQLAGDDVYLAGFADGLAGRALGDGNVVPLNGANGHGSR